MYVKSEHNFLYSFHCVTYFFFQIFYLNTTSNKGQPITNDAINLENHDYFNEKSMFEVGICYQRKWRRDFLVKTAVQNVVTMATPYPNKISTRSIMLFI